VIESEPTPKPFAVLTTALSVANPPETGAVPKVVLPIAKVTIPVSVPGTAELTDAVNAVVPPGATEAGAAVSVVAVTAVPVTDTVVLAIEAA
jgi:hypothetical protein